MLFAMNDTIGDELRAAGAGAASGIAATGAMSVLMVAARETGVMSELPPHVIADETAERVDADGRGDAEGSDSRGLGWVFHFGFGAAVGALYGFLRHRLRTPGGPLFHGSMFALGVWAVSYLGWVPALRIMPPATEDEPGRPPVMIAAHVLFGSILGVLMERSLPNRRLPKID